MYMKKYITLLLTLLFPQLATAADQTIEMLNKLGNENMGLFPKNCKS